MQSINIDFGKRTGKVKPMHAVNNGPVYKFASDQRVTNIDAYKDAGIPYARNHDASFFATYGGEHCVDVAAIFPDFDADPNDPASYDFVLTDEYIKVTEFAGTRTFYRLGSKIEHWSKKYNTLPPKDFKKWAIICEHIIRHYTEGWAEGFNCDIEYWEIWNEPDLMADDAEHKTTWGGTKAQFFEFYRIVSKHLKKCFPHLKIGGPAVACRRGWAKDFIETIDAPLDFFSWHRYADTPRQFLDEIYEKRQYLDKNGYNNTESILNEWNYVCGWTGDYWIESLKTMKNLKGSSFIAGTMCMCQYAPLDMLMYYDARPCGMNGMFNTDLICECLKGYYPFKMFNELYKLGEAVETLTDSDDIYACAAFKDDEAAIMFTHYNNDNSTQEVKIKVNVNNFNSESGIVAEYYLLDEENDLELVREETFLGNCFAGILKLPLFSSYLIKLKKL